jgi:hypothetical protein
VEISTELLRDPIVVVGIAAVVCLKAIDMVKTHRYRSTNMNGGNPVVAQLKVNEEIERAIVAAIENHDRTMAAEHTRTRETTVSEHAHTREVTATENARTREAVRQNQAKP